jgi:hypothetical protein
MNASVAQSMQSPEIVGGPVSVSSVSGRNQLILLSPGGLLSVAVPTGPAVRAGSVVEDRLLLEEENAHR